MGRSILKADFGVKLSNLGGCNRRKSVTGTELPGWICVISVACEAIQSLSPIFGSWAAWAEDLWALGAAAIFRRQTGKQAPSAMPAIYFSTNTTVESHYNQAGS
jgi:hypothetical protein